jgi:hypothetical protein
MKSYRFTLVATILLASGCARSTQIAPQTHLIECKRMDRCVEKAQELCPSGYTVANANSTGGGGNVVWTFPTDGSAPSYGVAPNTRRSNLTVTCR